MTLTIQPFEPVDVDLWGKKFVTVLETRSVQQKAQALHDKLANTSDDDEAFKLLAELVDVRLKPAGQGRKKPSELIIEKWEADELSLPQLEAFIDGLVAAARPT